MTEKSSKKKVLNKKPIQTKEKELKNVITEKNTDFNEELLEFPADSLDFNIFEEQESKKDDKNEKFSKNDREKSFKKMVPIKWKIFKIEKWVLSEILQENVKEDDYIIKWYDENWQLYNICYRDNKTIKWYVWDLLENMGIETMLTKRVRTILVFSIFNFLLLFIVWYFSILNWNIVKKITALQSQSTQQNQYIWWSINNLPKNTNTEIINNWLNISTFQTGTSISKIDEEKRSKEIREKMNNYYKSKEKTQTWLIDNL